VPGSRARVRLQPACRPADLRVATASVPRRRPMHGLGPRRRRRTGARGARVTAYPVEIDAHPESRVRNSQAHGIGRVVALDGLVAWNNLGRNVVFAGQDFVPRAVFDESMFDDDEPSQFDLDVHAILEPTGSGVIVVLNHY